MEMNRRTLLETVAAVLAASTTLPAAELQPALLNADQARAESHPFGASGSTATARRRD